MKRLAILAIGAVVLGAPGAQAQAQDREQPPPGCRWFGDEIGCKDGHGAWRRAGDREVLGHYAVTPPKPKPRPAPAPRAVVVAAPTTAFPLTQAPGAPGDAAASPQTSADTGFGADAAVNDAAVAETPSETTVDAPPPAEAAAPTPTPAAPKPWWQALWDWIVQDVKNLLRMVGLGK